MIDFKRGTTVFFLTGIVTFAQASIAPPQALNCPDQFDSVDQVSVHRLPTAQGECLLFVTPDTDQLTYRSFSFSNTGMFQIFNSYEPGDSQPLSGARTYFLFPRKRLPDFYFSESDHRLTVTLSDQSSMTFSTETARAIDWEHAFTEETSVNRKNKGGFEITGGKFLILDTGWAFRKPAYTVASGKSEFRDSQGSRCTLPNRDLFVYGQNDPKLRFASDSDLKKFLAERCPQLSFESGETGARHNKEENER